MNDKCFQCQLNVHLFPCEGCKENFCEEHLLKHREDLNDQIKQINDQCEHLREDLHGQRLIQSSLIQIDQWENESIDRIRFTAGNAREDLLKIFQRMKSQIDVSFDQLSHLIGSHQKTILDYERQFVDWSNELTQLRQIFEKSLQQNFVRKDSASIPLIKVCEEKDLVLLERFEKTTAPIQFSADYRTATSIGKNWNGSTLRGRLLYSLGRHSLRFQINRKGKTNLFFGITSAAKDSNPWTRQKPPFAFGWWDFPSLESDEQKIRRGDHLTLTLDCDHRQIQLEHHRTKRIIQELINDDQCPFPWRIAIVLYSPQDSVSILP